MKTNTNTLIVLLLLLTFYQVSSMAGESENEKTAGIQSISGSSFERVELSNSMKYESSIHMWLTMSSSMIRMVGLSPLPPTIVQMPVNPPSQSHSTTGGFGGVKIGPIRCLMEIIMKGLEKPIIFLCKFNDSANTITEPAMISSSGSKTIDEAAKKLMERTPKLKEPPAGLPFERGLLVIFQPKNDIFVRIAPEQFDYKNYKNLSVEETTKMLGENCRIAGDYIRKQNWPGAQRYMEMATDSLRKNCLIDSPSLQASNCVSLLIREVIGAGCPQELMAPSKKLVRACERNTTMGIRTYSFGNFGAHHGGNDGIFTVDYSLLKVGESYNRVKELLNFIFETKKKRLNQNFLVHQYWEKSLEALEKQRVELK